jgi:large subunit ribosomal protein L9
MQTQIILLQNIRNLGHMGDVKMVKRGYAHYLLRQNMAWRATDSNLVHFEKEKVVLEKKNRALHTEAEDLGRALEGFSMVLIRNASESGQLYGSVLNRDIADKLVSEGFKIKPNMVVLSSAIKMTGLYNVVLTLHAEIDASIQVVVARTEEDAERLLKGGDSAEASLETRTEVEELEEGLAEEGIALSVDEEGAQEKPEGLSEEGFSETSSS